MTFIFPIYTALMLSNQTATANAWLTNNLGFYAPEAEQGVNEIITTVMANPNLCNQSP